MSNIKDQIRQEIERRKKICEGIFERESDTYYQGKAVAYDETLAFIDSLPEEKPSYVTDSPGDPGDPGEPGMSDLEVAAQEYSDREMMSGLAERAFIDGAKWQENHAPLPEDSVAFNNGVEEGKRLIMEEAVEGEIGYWNQRGLSIRLDRSLERLGYDMDTKVKIVIVKQDE